MTIRNLKGSMHRLKLENESIQEKIDAEAVEF
jgi:hypothetical protein